MTADELRAFLQQRQVSFTEGAIQSGIQFRCSGGEIFNVYQTGRMSFQGRQSGLAHEIRQWSDSGTAPVAVSSEESALSTRPGPSKQVFIVYGRDQSARDNLELLLHRMDLEPIILQNLAAAGDTIIEKLERYLGEHSNVGFACVLLTPDDEGRLAGTGDLQYRARQNVILELGMVLTRLGRRRVAILHKQSIELPSDIAGLIYIPFQERVEEVQSQLHRELVNAGYSPKVG